jgi:hypothetical protein
MVDDYADQRLAPLVPTWEKSGSSWTEGNAI